MLNNERDEKDVAQAHRLLREARIILNIVRSTRIAVHGTSGERERRIQEMLQSATKRISSMYGDLEKLAPRQSDRLLSNFPHEPPPQTVKWGEAPRRNGSMRRRSRRASPLEGRPRRLLLTTISPSPPPEN